MTNSQIRAYSIIKSCELFLSQISEHERSRGQIKRLQKAFDKALMSYGKANCEKSYPVVINAIEMTQGRIEEAGNENYGVMTVYQLLKHYEADLCEFMSLKRYDFEALRNDIVRGKYKTAIIKMDISGGHKGRDGSEKLAKLIVQSINKAIYEYNKS